MSQMYNDPVGGDPSSIGEQTVTHYMLAKAIVYAKRYATFSPMSDPKNMPKNHGKTMKAFVYLPVLSDENVGKGGIDSSGTIIADGNLYATSRDVTTIQEKMPIMTEEMERVNMITFTRTLVQGHIEAMGVFFEYTEDSEVFDSDPNLMQHCTDELFKLAYEVVEDRLQLDLLSSAGVIRYTGDAVSQATINKDSIPVYKDFLNLTNALDDNQAPIGFSMLTGANLTDTRTIPKARPMFFGNEMRLTLLSILDIHGNPAFVGVEQYAGLDSAKTAYNEYGKIEQYRLIDVPKFKHWAGAGDSATGSSTNVVSESNGGVDVFPLLVVCKGSFSTIGFEVAAPKKGSAAGMKFNFHHMKPRSEGAYATGEFGKLGRLSLDWYYGFIAMRPDWIALMYSAALV